MHRPFVTKPSIWRCHKTLLVSLVLVLALKLCFEPHVGVSAHGHSHDESEENPSFKWSRAANTKEDEIMEEDIIDLPPQRGPSPQKVKTSEHSHSSHGHSHGGHGHSHGGHGHSHGGHGHSHGPPQKEPSPEEREKHRARLHKEWDDDEDADESGRNVWLQAIGATLLVCLAPIPILFFIPLDNSAEKRWLLKITLSFASGGLLGDAFLHLCLLYTSPRPRD